MLSMCSGFHNLIPVLSNNVQTCLGSMYSRNLASRSPRFHAAAHVQNHGSCQLGDGAEAHDESCTGGMIKVWNSVPESFCSGCWSM